jgi:HEAT repeat protein
MDQIDAMQEYGNLDGLIKLLRQERDPAVRARAARALGRLGEFEAAEMLTGAAINDPDIQVRRAARLALHDLLGNQAELVLKMAEENGERDDDWLDPQDSTGSLDDSEGFKNVRLTDGDPQTAFTDYETLRGLIMIARGDPNREMRLRATKSLASISDMTAIHALAELTLWDDDESIRQAAEAGLKSRYGEELPALLESYRKEVMGDDEDLEAPWESGYDPYASSPSPQLGVDSPQQQKMEGASPIGCLILVFLMLAALYLILR